MTIEHIPYRRPCDWFWSSIGAAIATELGRLGAKVIVNYANSAESAEKVVAGIKSLGSDAIAFKADVRQVSQTAKLMTDAEEFDRVFSLNTRGQFFVAREAYKNLNEGGRIILTSSNTSKDFSVPRHSLYSGSKGAIDSFVRILSKDCGDKKITVNAVAPGGTVTDMFHDVSHHYIPNGEKYSAEERQQMAAHASPLIRNGFPIDVARVVCFLASDEAEWVNGKVLTLDGGAA
ncbi:hypothetical protein N7450_001301 [Penicillium hetheringtonii]|uniref:Versicolorin reductase n=1 Tax=Penicillium hetheringtonii TaxID=911720 RepID=A0AAD6E4A7_9EURO|nr:hypothetical protein N7450_001301 [Penicillium hetheringtonii]